MPKRAPKGSGMIRQRADGRWEARYTVGRDPGTGKQIQKAIYGKTQDEVRRKLTEITKDIDDGVYADSGDITVGQWVDLWWGTYTTNLRDTTRSTYKNMIDLHIKPRIGALKLSKLSPMHIQQFYNKLAESGRVGQKKQKKEAPPGLSSKSIRNLHAILHKALKQATLSPHGLIKYNPADGVNLPAIMQKEMSVLSDDEIVALFNAASTHWHYSLYYTTLFCGLRRGETLGLQWKYINQEEGYIDIVWQAQREKKKGGQIRLVPLKNKGSRRIYPPKSVFEVLEKQRVFQDNMRKTAGEKWGDSDTVFTNETGGFLDADAVYSAFKTILKRAGISDIRLHDLRHTFATNAIAQGIDIKTLQEGLGHHDPGFTLKVYGHSTDTMKRAAAEKMGAFVDRLELKRTE